MRQCIGLYMSSIYCSGGNIYRLIVGVAYMLVKYNEAHQDGITSHILWYSDWLQNTTSAGSSIFIANHKTTSAGSSIM